MQTAQGCPTASLRFDPRRPLPGEAASLQAIWSASQDRDDPAGRPPEGWWSITGWATSIRVLRNGGAPVGVAAVEYSPGGQQLFFGSSQLSSYNLVSKQVRPLQSPPLATQDVIGYVAVNPVRPQEVAIATLGRDIFHATDGGQTWEQIAQSGRGK